MKRSEFRKVRMMLLVSAALGFVIGLAFYTSGTDAHAQSTQDAPLTTKDWTGGDNNNGNWTANANWTGAFPPGAHDTLEFPGGTSRKANNNDFPVNTPFDAIIFGFPCGGPGFECNYVVTGNQVAIEHVVFANVVDGTAPIFNPNILLVPDAINSEHSIRMDTGNTTPFVLNGVVNLNNQQLKVEAGESTSILALNGLMTGAGTLRKTGAGTVQMNGNSPGLVPMNVEDGTLDVGGTIGRVNLKAGKLSGAGTTGEIDATQAPATGTIDPGNGTTATATLRASAVTLASTATYTVDLNSPTQFDQLLVNGQNVFLNGAHLNVRLGYTPANGQQFTIINETGAGIVGGQFAQGTSINVNGRPFTITYSASSVVLTAGSIAPTTSTAFDFDGDHKTDISVFRPSAGEWYLNRSTQGFFGATFGQSTDKVTAADFTGDGKTDIAFFRPSTGNWFVLRSENSTFFAFPFGTNGDIPAPGDFDADGKADAAVYRPSISTWFVLRSSNGAVTSTQFGISTDQPVPSDYDGDGKADIAVWRSGPGEWWILKSSNGQAVGAQFGQSTDKPTPGDFTGDGKSDRAFFRPSTGTWFVLRSEDSSFFAFPFGQNGDKPAPGDYDGDGKFDAAVFRPTGSNWFINKSTGGVQIQQFGLSTDIPVPGALVP